MYLRIDATIDVVFSEITLPLAGVNWNTVMRDRALLLRDVLARHRWTIGLLKSPRHPILP
ncbi:hypothetical protein D6T63_10690 [Arthrobacter cheniae]|uniref:Uncharacterized protein n=1 Tax=Arthrobacter cheniae TaxID=1258888 RepID=A0A3A5M0L0_9MICC|nr:hypothetical protein [Arthrobacter cheniae]RJT79090.1 hypothetical protein D6T63_10690 [Arthrobacter cheniae]